MRLARLVEIMVADDWTPEGCRRVGTKMVGFGDAVCTGELFCELFRGVLCLFGVDALLNLFR